MVAAVTGACRQVIMMDRHTPGPLDGLWPAVAAGAGFAALNTSLDRLSSGMSATIYVCVCLSVCLSVCLCLSVHVCSCAVYVFRAPKRQSD